MNSHRMKAVFAIVGLCSFIFSSNVSAQTDDFGMDFSLEAEKKIYKGVNFSIEGNARTQDDTQTIERWGGGASLGVKLLNTKNFNLKASVKWEYMWIYNLAEVKEWYESETEEIPHIVPGPNGMPVREIETITETDHKYNFTDSFWRNRHRTSAALSATYTPNKRWAFSLKETFQYNHFCQSSKTTYKFRHKNIEDPDTKLYLKETEQKNVKAKDRTVLRSKVAVQYDTKHCPIDPYISGEYGCGLNYSANKWKLEAGADYKINKQNKLTFFYRYLTENDDDEPNGHLVGIGYSIKL